MIHRHDTAQLAAYTHTPKSQPGQVYEFILIPRIYSHHPARKKSASGEVLLIYLVGFLSLGSQPAYVGSSSGFAPTSSLGQMVQATVRNKPLASTVSEHYPRITSLAKAKRNSAGPPNDDMGSRILDAYLARTHPCYPFLDRLDIMERHANRFVRDNTSPQEFGAFKIYMIYAIGATLLKLTEPCDYTPLRASS